MFVMAGVVLLLIAAGVAMDLPVLVGCGVVTALATVGAYVLTRNQGKEPQ
jgi:hypothetical protein